MRPGLAEMLDPEIRVLLDTISPIIVKIASQGGPHIILMLANFFQHIASDIQTPFFWLFLGHFKGL